MWTSSRRRSLTCGGSGLSRGGGPPAEREVVEDELRAHVSLEPLARDLEPPELLARVGSVEPAGGRAEVVEEVRVPDARHGLQPDQRQVASDGAPDVDE